MIHEMFSIKHTNERYTIDWDCIMDLLVLKNDTCLEMMTKLKDLYNCLCCWMSIDNCTDIERLELICNIFTILLLHMNVDGNKYLTVDIKNLVEMTYIYIFIMKLK